MANVKVWQEGFPASNAPEFQLLLDKVSLIKASGKLPTNRRQIKRLSENDEVGQDGTTRFAKAYLALASVQVQC
jgi:hypothetical protein